MSKVNYTVNDNEFIIEDYNNARAFASFLPAIAGLWGKPMWAYYVNRGQAISNFGVKDKDGAILEFVAANKAWRLTSSHGFRTFYKINGNFSEPFRNSPCLKARQTMYIKPHSIRLKDRNEETGIETEALFCTLPDESFSALLRRLTIKNISAGELKIECLDGLPVLHPFGTRNWMLKDLSRLAEGWCAGVNFSPNGIPYYKLPVEALDRPEVVPITGTHFYCGAVKDNCTESIAASAHANKPPALYCIDPDTVFGEQKDFDFPAEFIKSRSPFLVNKNFSGKNKTPSAFGYFSLSLPAGKEAVYYSMTGHCNNYKNVDSAASLLLRKDFFEKKEEENEELLDGIASCAYTESAYKQFDNYCAQNFIDNALRGGFSVTIGENTHYYAYSRVHGDMEREYNNFVVLDEYFSQGNGNYRDVNQNRRSDIFFNRDIGDDNIHFFMNLIQSDGFNPLKVLGVRFIFETEENRQRFMSDFSHNVINKDILSHIKEKLSAYIKEPLTIGALFNFIEENDIVLSGRQKLLDSLLANAKKESLSAHGEGYWSDHWHYNTDLIENYLAVYPDRFERLLLGRRDYTYYDDCYFVEPRSVKYVLFREKPIQIRAVRKDSKKAALISSRRSRPNITRTEYGKGEVYRTTLLGKLLGIIANKYASLDPECLGVEMETDKPNWCDALNGLPGLFGSSSAESLELLRLVSFLSQGMADIAPDTKVSVTAEISDMLAELVNITKTVKDDYNFWDRTHTVKEKFRKKTFFGISGGDEAFTIKQIQEMLSVIEDKLIKSRAKIESLAVNGVIPTCFAFTPDSYDIDEKAEERMSPEAKARARPSADDHQAGATEAMQAMAEEKTPAIIVRSFRRVDLPLFLEGPVHYLRLCPGKHEAGIFHRKMLESPLYDKKLGMIKINAPIASAGHGIGRITIFTPGWLENESIWLHMEYKYLLELLRNNLADEFYACAKTMLVPFMDPAQYGRSVFENSSFIASSAHPEEAVHGQGFVARLSGATAEFISIWIAMTSGLKPFSLCGKNRDELCFALKPCLASDFFTDANTFTFDFMGAKTVYRNNSRKNTFGGHGAQIKSYRIIFKDGSVQEIQGSCVCGESAHAVRDGKADMIEVNLC
ncbi:MAG: hypothetical protein FWC03_09725 [Treponema sp.]|nr:hypothetical protein [Treponema sp.]